ncbi:MAG: DegV family protein [Clostridia bacterium]|nr:DegV family protein [Clostridia bacterium]
MKDFVIFADSAANVPFEFVKKYDIKIIPFLYNLEGVDYPCFTNDENFEETAKAFYNKLNEGADIKTTLVNEARIIEAVEPAMKDGKDAVIFTITADMSGTFNQATKAKAVLEEKYKGCKLHVLDSANASMGEGLQVIKFAEMKAAGESLENCLKYWEETVYKVNSFVTVADLKYLKRSGRVSTIIALAGTLLNIKPIMWANGTAPAKLTVCAKERGRKKSLMYILEAFKQRVENPAEQTIAITHADCREDALWLAEQVKALGAKDVIIEYYDLCTGAHVGPGTIALFFLGKDRRG